MASLVISNPAGVVKQVVPNLLPCQIHHDGKLEASDRHWDVKAESDGTPIVHLRGRRLVGQAVQVPETHTGAVLRFTPEEQQPAQAWTEEADVQDDEEEAEGSLIVEQTASFDKIMVWKQDVAPEAGEDAYLKGIDEWIGMAEAIHAP